MNAIRTPRDERNGDGTRTRQRRVRLLDSTDSRNATEGETKLLVIVGRYVGTIYTCTTCN